MGCINIDDDGHDGKYGGSPEFETDGCVPIHATAFNTCIAAGKLAKMFYTNI